MNGEATKSAAPENALVYPVPVDRPLQVRDIPLRMRPREEFDRRGAENVSDAVLLALLLRSGTRGRNVVELANQLLIRHGSLSALARASTAELAQEKGMGPVKAQVLKAALELARRIAEERIGERPLLNVPGRVAELMREEVRRLEHEQFWILPLNVRNRLIAAPLLISKGTVDSSLVHPREIFKETLRTGCASVILVHNHPSGDPSPSAQDLAITRKLIEAGRLIGVHVLDHVILGIRNQSGENDFISLRESGLVVF